ncbi:MAG: alpha/beta hydrolase [Candidatus Sericytochromatia bacterium]
MADSLHFERVSHWPGRIYRSQPLNISGLEGERPVSLWLPPDYPAADAPATERRWPLAVFFDGQNLFGDEGTLGGGWQLHTALTERANAGAAVPVGIGLHHGAQRESELSPWDPFPGVSGRAKSQLEWIKTSLLPELYSDLQLDPNPDHCLVGGSSLGGLLALYALFHQPESFGKALVMSPALWPNRFAIFQDLMLQRPRPQAKIYLDHGQREVLEPGKEHFGQILFEQTQLMADLLEVMGFEPGHRLSWNPDPEGEHNERCWSRRLPKALDFLYDNPTNTPIPKNEEET